LKSEFEFETQMSKNRQRRQVTEFLMDILTRCGRVHSTQTVTASFIAFSHSSVDGIMNVMMGLGAQRFKQAFDLRAVIPWVSRCPVPDRYHMSINIPFSISRIVWISKRLEYGS